MRSVHVFATSNMRVHSLPRQSAVVPLMPRHQLLQDKLNQITAQFLAVPKASQRLEDYIADCAALLGLRSSRLGQGIGAEGDSDELQRAAKLQLLEVLEAVVQCKMDYAGGASPFS